MRDYLLRWDPEVQKAVDQTCRRVFNLNFDQMLSRNPRFILACTPRYVPPPSVLVPALEVVFDTFGKAVDASNGAHLFNDAAWKKSSAILQLAQEGYLLDLDGVALYEKDKIDQYGLQKYRCLRGTNKVEGGPHGDIYCKFGALHAGPRLTVNSLTDHRTWFNLQALAKHSCGVDWEYHHDIGLLNRISFLLSYLSDLIGSTHSYALWINGDLYERTSETFGVCEFPALPVLPPTTPAARKYFFQQLSQFTIVAANKNSNSTIDLTAFACEWNRTADGKDRFYITTEVLSSYVKSWRKINNIRALRDLVSDDIHHLERTRSAFMSKESTFPEYMVTDTDIAQPICSVLKLGPDMAVPKSISIQLPASRALPLVLPPSTTTPPPVLHTPTPPSFTSHSDLTPPRSSSHQDTLNTSFSENSLDDSRPLAPEIAKQYVIYHSLPETNATKHISGIHAVPNNALYHLISVNDSKAQDTVKLL
ncbi:hypothetical protein EV361DRAFT_954161 [Lentinula raphanica]|nr:hypothetical protein EV361DRAFT_954161 [Lentinula raphanica]